MQSLGTFRLSIATIPALTKRSVAACYLVDHESSSQRGYSRQSLRGDRGSTTIFVALL